MALARLMKKCWALFIQLTKEAFFQLWACCEVISHQSKNRIWSDDKADGSLSLKGSMWNGATKINRCVNRCAFKKNHVKRSNNDQQMQRLVLWCVYQRQGCLTNTKQSPVEYRGRRCHYVMMIISTQPWFYTRSKRFMSKHSIYEQSICL